MKLNFFLGTAAELIKVYPVIRQALQRGFEVRVISSGQSRENFLMQYRDFALPEEFLVTMVSNGGDLARARSALKWFLRAACTRRAKFSELLLRGEKEFLIVHGDTLSTLVGAWHGRRCGIPVVHVEAGLRSPRLLNPFPEEITRRLVSRFASVHMAPDAKAVENLAGVRGRVVNTGGNTLLDAVLSSEKSSVGDEGKYILINIHRFENLNSHARWSQIINTVVRVALNHKVIFVRHPQTRQKLMDDRRSHELLVHAHVELRDRVPFSEFMALLKGAEFLISDGGSNQEECSYLGKPCLLMREASERVEGLDSCCVLSRFDQKVIDEFLGNPSQFEKKPIAVKNGPSASVLEALIQKQ